MGLFDFELFLGFEINGEIQELINQLPEKKRNLFIKKEGAYLQPTIFESRSYLGKQIGKSMNLKEVSNLKQHLSSLISIVFGDNMPNSPELHLLPYSTQEETV